MSNNPQKALSQKKQVKSALERIGELEGVLPQIIAGFNQALMQLEQRLGEFGEAIDALVELAGGKDLVDSVIQSHRVARATANLNAALARGDLVKVEAVSEKSVIVGREFDKDGNLVPPGRVQLSFRGFKPEFREKLLGKGVGFVFDIGAELAETTGTPAGETVTGKFEVSEVYDRVEKAPENPGQVPAETSKQDSSNAACEGCEAKSCDGCAITSPDGFAEPKTDEKA